jgi:hypothetical protein
MSHEAGHYWMSVAAAVLLAVTVGIASANIAMSRVAAFWEEFAGTFPCGDANHNLLPEIYGTSDHNHDSLVIYENQGGNSYREIKTGVRIRWVRDFGYGDGESLAELINAVTIYRALNPDTFPTESVYTFNPPCGAIFTKFTDLDRDGRCEVAFGSNGVNGSGINLYENQGVDQWVHVPFPWSGAEGQFAFADFDQDGHTEIASGDADGDLYIFKCTGDDQYVRVCSTSLAPDVESYCCTAANDLEGDSVPRFIILSLSEGGWCNVRVYQTGPESLYQCIWSTQIQRGDEDYWSISAGDVNGDSKDEFAITNGAEVLLFENTGKHQYQQVWQYSPGGAWAQLFDLNGDGRKELIISPDSTYIFEDTNGLGVAEFTKLPQLHTVTVQPTIARLGAPVMFSGVPPGADIEVHSLDGRLVNRAQGVRQSTWTWDLRNQSGNLVPAGTYFAVIRSKGRSTSLKLCLVK